jgi:hypothetical protein
MHPSRTSEPSRGFVASSRWLVVLMCAATSIGGALVFRHGLAERRLNHEATQWPEAEGRVERGWVKTTETRGGSSANRSYHNAFYEVMVDYTFAAENLVFAKTSPAPRQIGEDEGKTVAQSIADSYAPGTKITVFYRPGNPAESRLRRVEVNSIVWLWFAIAGGLTVFTSIGGGWWILHRFGRRSTKTTEAA